MVITNDARSHQRTASRFVETKRQDDGVRRLLPGEKMVKKAVVKNVNNVKQVAKAANKAVPVAPVTR